MELRTFIIGEAMGLLTDILKGLPENAVLRHKVVEAQKVYDALEAENASLRDDLRAAKAENTKLREKLEKLTKADDLDASAIQILEALGEHKVIIAPEMEHLLQIEHVQLTYSLQVLRDAGYIVKNKPVISRPARYSLAQKGREYLLKRRAG
jgi:heme oxygenase